MEAEQPGHGKTSICEAGNARSGLMHFTPVLAQEVLQRVPVVKQGEANGTRQTTSSAAIQSSGMETKVSS